MKPRATALLVAVLLAAAPLVASAQTPTWQHQIVFNSGPQFVTGDRSEAFKTGFAIDVGYYYRATDHFFVGAYGGYHQFVGTNGGSDRDVIPVNLAVKYNLSLTGLQPYVGLEGGPVFLSNGRRSTEAGLAPRIGLRVPLSRGIDLDLTLKYNAIFRGDSSFTYVGANGGFAYILDRTNIQYR